MTARLRATRSTGVENDRVRAELDDTLEQVGRIMGQLEEKDGEL